MLDEHYHCKDPNAVETPTPEAPASADKDLDEDVPMEFNKKETAVEDSDDDPLEDDKVKELLAGLDDV